MKFRGGRRYNAYVEHLRSLYGGRLQKVAVDAGFTCPNRDGTKGVGGCTFCDNRAFHPSYIDPKKSLTHQIEEGIEFQSRRYRKVEGYLAYFQPYTNTYGEVELLERLYREALSHPLVKGVVIGTRPDCVDKDKISLLEQLSKEHIVIVEYGIESIYNSTLRLINRGHTFEETVTALELTRKANLESGGHFIFGLPGESREEMLGYADVINSLPLNAVKFHQLQIVVGTEMEKLYQREQHLFVEWELEEYIDFFIDFLELLRPTLLIERFAGEVPPRFTSTSPWGSVRNFDLVRMVQERMEERDTFQSKRYRG